MLDIVARLVGTRVRSVWGAAFPLRCLNDVLVDGVRAVALREGSGLTERNGFRGTVRLRILVSTAALLASTFMLQGCVSAVEDSSAFGFAGSGGTPNQDAAAAIKSDGSDVAESETAAKATAPTEEAPATEEAVAAGGNGPSPKPSSAAALLQPASSDRSLESKSIAAFAGGSVSQGDAATTGAPQNKSLFASLFARSEAKTPVANSDRGKGRRVILRRNGAPESTSDNALPGVDPASLFEIGQRASADEDMVEDLTDGGSYQVASLSGLARLAPNGLRVQRESVETACFPRGLVSLLRRIESRFGKPVVVTSGYRSPSHNRAVNGARLSQHMGCKAADIIVPDVDRFAVAQYVRSLPDRGGVGTYCNTVAIHVDVGPKRDWNWRCRNRSIN